MKRLLLLALLLAGCGSLPKDTDATVEHIRAQHVVRIGAVLSRSAGGNAARKLIRGIAEATGARPKVIVGDAESLIAALNHDEIDVVIGPFDADTPWTEKVALAPPVAQLAAGTSPMYLRAAVRNGENRWAMLVEHASRAVAPDLTDRS